MITYISTCDHITPQHLTGGFFVGWPNPPTPETHLRILQNSYKIWLAIDSSDRDQVVGYVTAISDGVLAAFIPNLEVLPAYQGQGIGRELTQRMLESLRHLYSIDLMCDPDVAPFYTRLGMRPAGGMLIRHYNNQSGSNM